MLENTAASWFDRSVQASAFLYSKRIFSADNHSIPHKPRHPLNFDESISSRREYSLTASRFISKRVFSAPNIVTFLTMAWTKVLNAVGICLGNKEQSRFWGASNCNGNQHFQLHTNIPSVHKRSLRRMTSGPSRSRLSLGKGSACRSKSVGMIGFRNGMCKSASSALSFRVSCFPS